jgi:hypothetical protein
MRYSKSTEEFLRQYLEKLQTAILQIANETGVKLKVEP